MGTTNNKPSVIARYFIDSVLKLKGGIVIMIIMYIHDIGAPSVLRCDLGTENTYLSWIQPFLRQHHVDSLSIVHRHVSDMENQFQTR